MKTMRLFALLLLALSLGAQAQTYRWKDASGKVQFTDTPPPGKTRVVEETIAPPVDPLGGIPFATRQAAMNYPVTLYSPVDCSAPCQQARELLKGRAIPFTEKVVQKPEDIAELKQLVGDNFVPSLKVGRESSRGYETGAWNKLLDLAGYPRAGTFNAKPQEKASK